MLGGGLRFRDIGLRVLNLAELMIEIAKTYYQFRGSNLIDFFYCLT